MADEKQLRLTQQAVDAWNYWQAQGYGKEADLRRGAALSEADLTGGPPPRG